MDRDLSERKALESANLVLIDYVLMANCLGPLDFHDFVAGYRGFRAHGALKEGTTQRTNMRAMMTFGIGGM